mgnify:CR=1 FL=1
MGFYEHILGVGVIPAFLIVLVLLANGTGRRQLNKIILSVVGVEIHVSGYSLRVVHMLTFVNLLTIFQCLHRISKLNKLQAEHDLDHGSLGLQKTEFLKELYLTYRNLLMNLCSIVLMICVNAATAQYDVYKALRERADRVRAE